MAAPFNIMALDVGHKRVGLAVASSQAKLPRPLKTLLRGDSFFDDLSKAIQDEDITMLVVGLPRGLNGTDTEQTKATRLFVAEIERKIDLPVYLEDETLSSVRAEATLRQVKPKYTKADIDAYAARHLLEDFIAHNPEVFVG